MQTFLYHPRKLWLRRALFQIHLWMGVLLAIYVVVIALTGSVLVFRNELTRVMLPAGMNAYDAGRVAPIEEVLQGYRVKYPAAKVQGLQMPSERLPVFVLTGVDAGQRPLRLVGDPVSGKLWAQPRGWLDWVYDLHVYLLLSHAYGMQVNGIGAVGLLVLAASGLVIWWPGVKTWIRGVKVDRRRNWRRINYDAHSAVGFWTLLIVSWWGISGVYFGWYREVTAVVAWVSPLRGMVSPKAAAGAHGMMRISMEQVLAAVHRTSPEGRLFSLSDPMFSGESTFALVDLRAAGDFSHRDIVQISTVDGRVLSVWHYGANHTAGDWFVWAMHPLHFGTIWGLGFEVLWAALGVALALLAVTGVVMYWNRYLRHAGRRMS